jgi:hypothetical protein
MLRVEETGLRKVIFVCSKENVEDSKSAQKISGVSDDYDHELK